MDNRGIIFAIIAIIIGFTVILVGKLTGYNTDWYIPVKVLEDKK